MEASGNPPPPEEPAATPATPPPPPPPPPATAEVDDGKASGGWRALSVVLALALVFAGAVMIIVGADLLDTPIGIENCRAEPGCTEYYDGSSAERAIQVVLTFI